MQKLKKIVQLYKPDKAGLFADIRTLGKVLAATGFAILVYPGDGKHVPIGIACAVVAVIVYAVGLHKVEDAKK